MFFFLDGSIGGSDMEMVLLVNLKTGQQSVVSIQRAAKITQLDGAEIVWAFEEFGACETTDYWITDTTCFLLENGSQFIGYFRCLGNAQAIATHLSAPTITELHLQEDIACEDDPLPCPR